MVKGNPFLSPTFTGKWQRFFTSDRPLIRLKFIEGPYFVRHRLFPFLYSCGGVDTKGVEYKVVSETIRGFHGQVALVYDVQSGLKFNGFQQLNPSLSRTVVKQYPGYFIDLTPFDSFENYMSSVFSGKSRRKLFSYRKKMERELETTSQMYYGKIDRVKYDEILDALYDILKRRFRHKKELNSILKEPKWGFYKEVTYQLMLEKKASLFVVSQNQNPICIMLNFMDNTTLIGGITGFDMDYQAYNVGTIAMMQQIEWAFANKFKYVDFSKGDYDYKKRWGSTPYDFEYHILFDKKSIKARLIAFLMARYFEIKQVLREKGVNNFMHRLAYRLG